MDQLDGLSRREREVAKLLLEGKSNKLIASALGISERTVEFHLKNIFAKVQVSSRVELILKLGESTGAGKPVESTVAGKEEIAENGDRLNRWNWSASLREAVAKIGKEFRMEWSPNSFNPSIFLLVHKKRPPLRGRFLWDQAGPTRLQGQERSRLTS